MEPGNYLVNVASKQQEETQVIGLNTELKSIKTIMIEQIYYISIRTNKHQLNSNNRYTKLSWRYTNRFIKHNSNSKDEAKDNSLLALEGVETLEGTTAGILDTTTDLTRRMEYQETTVSDLVLDIDGVKQSMTYSGGYNLIEKLC